MGDQARDEPERIRVRVTGGSMSLQALFHGVQFQLSPGFEMLCRGGQVEAGFELEQQMGECVVICWWRVGALRLCRREP